MRRLAPFFFLLSLVGLAPLLLGAAANSAGPALNLQWQPVGAGGGGALYFPAFSPHQGGRVLTLSCDMGGSYRSLDQGRSWQMMDFGVQARPGGPIGYHQTDPRKMFAVRYRKIWSSTDSGASWRPVADVQGIGNGEIVVDPERPERIWLPMTREAQTPLFLSRDGGAQWKASASGIPWRTQVRALQLDLASPPDRRRLFAATSAGFYLSEDAGTTWRSAPGLPGQDLVAMAGFSSRPAGTKLLVAVAGKGVYRSRSGGANWQAAGAGLPRNGAGCRFLVMSRASDRIAYAVCGPGEIFRSDNGGDTWRKVHDAMKDRVANCWVSKELGPGWAGQILGLALNPSDPLEIVFTDFMRACRSRDGGASWQGLHSLPAGSGWRSTGLGVTNCYQLSFDPHDARRRLVSYTDVGLFKSIDSGSSWQRSVRGVPRSLGWSNTCYELAFDPARPGLIWGAFSRLHDLPYSLGKLQGGICVSYDGAESWSPLKGLPDLPATAIVLDPCSPVGSRLLFAGLYTGGVYRSSDGGRSWVSKSRGLPERAAVWRLVRHRDGTLLCALSGNRQQGGLYRSRDQGESWSKIDQGVRLGLLMDIALDPRSSSTIYATSSAGAAGEGGLFKSGDGGRSWRRLLPDPQVWGVTLDPHDPQVLYACTLATGGGRARGVLRSDDAGKSWLRLAGLPFYNLHKVTVDPRDPSAIFVTTFGGEIWKTVLPSREPRRRPL